MLYRLITICHSFSEDVPTSGWRRVLIRCSYRLTAYTILVCGGVLPWQKDIEYDYSEYLGPNYHKDIKTERISTIVSNHASWMDIIILVAGRYMPSFASKKELKTLPVIGLLTSAL